MFTAAAPATPKALADAIREVLPPEDCCYFGTPDAAALAAQRLYIGFWTDKGTCDGDTAAFLAQLTNQEVFLFGTAGFGGSAEYFEQIAHRVEALLPAGVTILGHHLCQGRMPMTVRQRYAAMEGQSPAGPRCWRTSTRLCPTLTQRICISCRTPSAN